MVHGLGGSATNWTDLMGLLQDRLDSVAPDLPGFGWSPPPPRGDYSLRTHARRVTELLETYAEPVHLLGNSLGGTVSMVVAATRPDLVRTLTLVSPALPVLRPHDVERPPAGARGAVDRAAAGPRLDRYPVDARVKASIDLCFADPARVPPQRFDEAIDEADRRARLGHESEAMLCSLRSLIAAYLRPVRWPLWPPPRRCATPTLLVYGLKDKLVDPRTACAGRTDLPAQPAAGAARQRPRVADGASRDRGPRRTSAARRRRLSSRRTQVVVFRRGSAWREAHVDRTGGASGTRSVASAPTTPAPRRLTRPTLQPESSEVGR